MYILDYLRLNSWNGKTSRYNLFKAFDIYCQIPFQKVCTKVVHSSSQLKNIWQSLLPLKIHIFINTCSLNTLRFASFYIICIKYSSVKVKTWINVWSVKLSNLYSQLCSSNQITMVLSRLRKWLSFTKELES